MSNYFEELNNINSNNKKKYLPKTHKLGEKIISLLLSEENSQRKLLTYEKNKYIF